MTQARPNLRPGSCPEARSWRTRPSLTPSSEAAWAVVIQAPGIRPYSRFGGSPPGDPLRRDVIGSLRLKTFFLPYIKERRRARTGLQGPPRVVQGAPTALGRHPGARERGPAGSHLTEPP